MRFPEIRWTRSLPTPLVLTVARFGPCGLMRPGPGTWGSVAGVILFMAMFRLLGWWGALLADVGLIYLAVAFCGEAEIRLGKKDPGEVVLDEVVVMPLCYLGWSTLTGPLPVWGVLLAGFVLFRIFDIAKPCGIYRLQDMPGGWGVVVDDVAAALAACATLHLGVWLLRLI